MTRLGIVVLFVGGAAWASTVCQTGPLSSYTALGAGGCMLAADGVTFTSPVVFSNFSFTPVAGTSASAANSIEVTPIANPDAPALDFTSQQITGAAQVIENISFTVSASSISSTSLFLQAFQATGSATVSVSATACGVGVCYSVNNDGGPTSITPVDSLAITDEFQLSGFAMNDSAQISLLANWIATPGGYGTCDCGFPAGGPVPEPPTLPLAATAAILMLAWQQSTRASHTANHR
jgi:hypothetical protein